MDAEKDKIITLLKTVVDPELMVNIVDLGLVYKINHNEIDKTIDVDMTLTSTGCPLGEVIKENVSEVLRSNYPNHTLSINIVWEPAWNTDRLTSAGKEALGRT